MIKLTQVDKAKKRQKGMKIASVLEEFAGNLRKLSILDIGTGSGYIDEYLSERCSCLYSVDVDDMRLVKKGYHFRKYPGDRLPFRAGRFDIVVSNGVIEHVKDQQKHLDEIYRVLKKGGIAYIATPNKYWIIDPHTKLPFISCLPAEIADRYMKLAGVNYVLFSDGRWDVRALSYPKLKLLSRKFKMFDVTSRMMKSPEKYGLDEYKAFQLARFLPAAALKLLKYLSPTFVVILKKS